MTALKAHEVEHFVIRPTLKNGIFLVYGPDAGLVRENAQRLITYFLENAGAGADNSSNSLQLSTLDMADIDADPGRLAVEARTTSLFGEAPVIRLRNASKALAPAVEGLLKDMPETKIIIEAGNLLPRDKLRALAEKSPDARTLPCYADNAGTLSGLIEQTFRDAGINVEREALSLLRDSLGNDREVTRRELEKLSIYASQSKILTINDVVELCGDNTTITTDRIVDATGTGHAANLETALGRAFGASLDPQRILIASLNHFLFLRLARAQIDQGLLVNDVLNRSHPRPHFSRKTSIEQQLRLWNDKNLARAAERINTAIHQSRQQPALDETIARRTLLALCMAASRR